MPKGLVPKDIKDKIDAFFEYSDPNYDPFDDRLEISVIVGVDEESGIAEFDRVMSYLTKVLNLPENQVNSYLDNPAEAVIEVYRFPYRPIDISDDDLPF